MLGVYLHVREQQGEEEAMESVAQGFGESSDHVKEALRDYVKTMLRENAPENAEERAKLESYVAAWAKKPTPTPANRSEDARAKLLRLRPFAPPPSPEAEELVNVSDTSRLADQARRLPW